MRRLASALAASILILGALERSARAADVAHAQQALLLLRALAYDRNLGSRAGSSATVMILFRPGNGTSEAVRDTMSSTLAAAGEKVKVAGLTLKVVSKAYESPADLGHALGGVGAVYLCPGLDGSARDITAVTRVWHVLSFSGAESMVTAGVAVGFVSRDGKPVVLVNLPASKAEGADLDAALLRIAEVIRS